MQNPNRGSSWVSFIVAGLFSGVLATSAGLAGETAGPPECLSSKGKPLAVNNEEVLGWKRNTPNQYLDRGRVVGTIKKDYGQRGSHDRFSLQIGPDAKDTLEIIYNKSFGDLPAIREGMSVEACGDYITSNAPTPQYPNPSPDNALLHWVHKNPNGSKHAHGWLWIEGKLYGWFGAQ